MLTLEIFSDGERWQIRCPMITVLISPEVLLPGMIFVNYLILEYLVWFLKVAGVDTGNIFRWRTMAASFSKVTVLISPELLFTGMISVNLIREYLVWFLKVAGVDTGNIFRWRTMAASFSNVTVLISPEVLFTGMIYVNSIEYFVYLPE